MKSPDLARLYRRTLKHWHWGRSQGFGRLIEEDELNPFTRVPRALEKWWWRRTHGHPGGSAMPVWLAGVQRSGTNMLVRGLEVSPEFEVYNENNRRAFERFNLRSDEAITAIIRASRHRYVLFKPLCDSHQIARLLDELPVRTPGRALWAYRDVDGRIRSSLAKFGDANLRVLGEIAAGTADHRWQAQGLSESSLRIVRSFDYAEMSAESASALFWYVRNRLFFETGLDRRPDVMAVSYDGFVAEPQAAMQAVCNLLDFPFSPRLIAHIEPRDKPGLRPIEIDPRIRELCDELGARLDAAAQDAMRRAALR